MATIWLTVKNWAEFQHYADRNPTWIKLHRALLDDYEFCALPDHAKSHLMLIWLFASQSGGRVPADPQFLAKKLGLNRAVDLDQLVASGFLIPEAAEGEEIASCNQGASKPLALVEKRREQKPKSRRRTLPQDFGISEEVRAWAKAAGYDQIEASLAYFRDYATANEKLYADWDAAFRNCIKADWGKARELARKAGPTTVTPITARCVYCPEPATEKVGGSGYCGKHAADERQFLNRSAA